MDWLTPGVATAIAAAVAAVAALVSLAIRGRLDGRYLREQLTVQREIARQQTELQRELAVQQLEHQREISNSQLKLQTDLLEEQRQSQVHQLDAQRRIARDELAESRARELLGDRRGLYTKIVATGSELDRKLFAAEWAARRLHEDFPDFDWREAWRLDEQAIGALTPDDKRAHGIYKERIAALGGATELAYSLRDFEAELTLIAPPSLSVFLQSVSDSHIWEWPQFDRSQLRELRAAKIRRPLEEFVSLARADLGGDVSLAD